MERVNHDVFVISCVYLFVNISVISERPIDVYVPGPSTLEKFCIFGILDNISASIPSMLILNYLFNGRCFLVFIF